MTASFSNQQEILHLSELACSGSATPDDFSKLSELITQNPALAQTYMSYLDMHSTLATNAKDSINAHSPHPFQQLESELSSHPVSTLKKHTRLQLASLVLLAVLSTSVLVWALFLNNDPNIQPVAVAEILSFSSKFQHPEEVDPTQAWLNIPSIYVNKPYFLKHGTLTLNMLNNTQVTILGPAHFTPLSNNSIKLDSGELSAYITEQGQNFSVNTRYLNFLDQGTAFTVSVADHHTELRVFSGNVHVTSTSSSPKSFDKQLSNNAFKFSHQDAKVEYFPISNQLPDSWLSQLTKIDIHSTGTGKLIGQSDSKWIITHPISQKTTEIKNTDPDVSSLKRTISTVVEEPRTRYERNSESSSWLTLYDNKPLRLICLPNFPHNTEYVFTTTFNLEEPDLSTAFIMGKFWVDDFIKEIRLNDVSVPLQVQNMKTLYKSPTEFVINSNFRKGHNTLSFVVQNGGPNPTPDKIRQTSQMAFRAELAGYYHKKSRAQTTN